MSRVRKPRVRPEAPALATVTSGGRVTLPKAIRAQLGLKPGDKLGFNTLSDGRVVLRPKTRRLGELAGLLTRLGQPSISKVELLSLPAAAEVEVDFDPPLAPIVTRIADWG